MRYDTTVSFSLTTTSGRGSLQTRCLILPSVQETPHDEDLFTSVAKRLRAFGPSGLRAFGLLLLTPLLCGCVSRANSPMAEFTPVGLLHASPAQMDLGNLPQGGRAEAICQLLNSGTATVEVARINTDCPCLTLELPNCTIAPSESVQGRVLFDISDDPRFTGALGMDVTGTTPEGATAFVVNVRVKVQRSNAN
jgi:hypothetical protein